MKSNRISLNYRKSLTTFLSLENQKINIKDKLFYYFLRHEDSISEFEKTFEDANDYLKFLQTLERSIKDLSSDDLAVIEHSIPGIPYSCHCSS